MARYESATGNRFWEVMVVGNRVLTRHGPLGSDGRMGEPKELATPAEAYAEAEKRAADKLKKGFVRVDEEHTGYAHNPELAAAVLTAESRDDPAPYLIYGDWLQNQGDPRGELVMVQHDLARYPDDSRLQKAEEALRKKLTPRRLDKMLKKRRTPDKHESGYCALAWKLGFIHAAHIGRSSDRPPYTVRELVAQLLAHPSAELMQSLVIGALGPGEYDYEPVLNEIALAAPASLRELWVTDVAPEYAELAVTRLGDVSVLYGKLPRLERLHLRGGAMELGEMNLPGLRDLTVCTVAFEEACLRAVGMAEWPVLRRLSLRAGRTALPTAGLAVLFHAPGMGALKELAILDTDDTGTLVRALRDSDRLRELETLDLSGGTLNDEDACMLVEHRESFAHLRRLVVEGNMMSEKAAASLHGICPEVLAGQQRPASAGRPVISNQQIAEFAPDPQSLQAARKLVARKSWPDLGCEGTLVWGRCQGRELYDVYVDLESMESGCTCPSMKYPCKHAIALLMMVAQAQPIPDMPPPEGFVEGLDVLGRRNAYWG